MNCAEISGEAAEWAFSQMGCAYSQANRTKENIFDCSSLVARAYSAQGKKRRYGGSVPPGSREICDDEFEPLWPATHAEIRKKQGGTPAVNKARQPGDLQFLCTDFPANPAN